MIVFQRRFWIALDELKSENIKNAAIGTIDILFNEFLFAIPHIEFCAPARHESRYMFDLRNIFLNGGADCRWCRSIRQTGTVIIYKIVHHAIDQR